MNMEYMPELHVVGLDIGKQLFWNGFKVSFFDLGLTPSSTFNNISVISWQPVILVEEARVPGENLGQVTNKPYHMWYEFNTLLNEYEEF